MKHPINIYRDETAGLSLWLTNIGVDAYGNHAVWIAQGDHIDDLHRGRKIQLMSIPAWGRTHLPTPEEVSNNPALNAALVDHYRRFCLGKRQDNVQQQNRGIRI